MNTSLRRTVATLTLAAAAFVPVAGANAATATTTAPAKAATSTAKKVNANTATAAQLKAAFTSAGVTNAARWVKEVQEYRPYTADFAKLKQELGKYGIAPAQLAKIISTLTV